MATFVLVHGAWHGGWCYRETAAALREAGHTVFTPTHTGVGERAHLAGEAITLETHVRDVLGCLEKEELDEVILCGHSYGGMVITQLADRARDRIKALAYIDAFVPGHGESLIDLLNRQRRQGTSVPSVILDLSLIRPFDYYTGIVFEVINNAQLVGQGGRYDDLLSVYDPVPNSNGFPGIGFVLNIEQLHRALLPDSQMPKETPPSDWLIVPSNETAVAAALSYAQKARESANVVRVEMSLDLSQSPDEVRAIAHKRKINRIAWISDQGLPDIEIVH